MAKRFLRSIVSDFQTLTASVDITPVDLPVNPLSHLILTIGLTDTTSRIHLGTYLAIQPFLDMISDLSIRHRGENIIQGSLQDLVVLNMVLHNASPSPVYMDSAHVLERSVQFIISFARHPYDHDEAFPATSRGNLRFYMTAAGYPSAVDSARWALEAVEMIEDTPATFLKYTTLTRAIPAAGRQKMPLPIGNELLGALLYDPTDEIVGTPSFCFSKVKVMKDNVEQYYAESNWQALRATMGSRCPGWHLRWGHIHEMLDTAFRTAEEQVVVADRPPLQYGYLDFDPLNDGSFALDAKGVSSLDIDLNSGPSSGTVRVLPVELIQVGGK